MVPLDVTDLDSIRAAVAHAETEVGSIDILVNNSGVSTTQRIQDVAEEDFDYVFDTNVKGAFFVAQEVGKRMLARARGAAPGTFTGGRIINIASMAGLRPLPQIGVYAMSKAAVVQMTKALALEWGRFEINVNAICPGYIDTEINHHHWQTEQGQKLVQHAAAQARGQPGGPGRAAGAAGQQREPLHQRGGDRGRRRLRHLIAERTLTGVLAGLAAGALWGLVFVAPRMVGGYSPVDLTAGRFVAYGAVVRGADAVGDAHAAAAHAARRRSPPPA